MTYRGKVKNGVVVLEAGAKIPDGIEVRVEPVAIPEEDQQPAIYKRLSKIAGKAKGLPRDLAGQHDHYLYGREKQ